MFELVLYQLTNVDFFRSNVKKLSILFIYSCCNIYFNLLVCKQL